MILHPNTRQGAFQIVALRHCEAARNEAAEAIRKISAQWIASLRSQ